MEISEYFIEAVGADRLLMSGAYPELILGPLPVMMPDKEPYQYAIWWPYQKVTPRPDGLDGLPDLRAPLVTTGFIHVQDDGIPVYIDLLPQPAAFWEPNPSEDSD